MKSFLSPWLIILSGIVGLLTSSCTRKADVETDRVHIGDQAPAFEVITLDGQKFSLKEQQGKVVVLDFFATWCGPCLEEMPHLEKELWQKYKGRKVAMIALGREHTNDELKPFKEKNQLTFPLAGDTDRRIFDQYAEKFIPRLLLIGPDGKIIDQIVGYDEQKFKALLAKVDLELAKLN